MTAPRPATRAETACAMVALAALAVGILALDAHVWLRAATVDVAVSYSVVAWVLARGLNR